MLNRNRRLLLLVTCAMLVALGVVLKLYSISISLTAKMSFAPVPAMAAGILFGPLAGLVVGALTDVMGFLVQGGGLYIPTTTIMYGLSGVVPALFVSSFRLVRAEGGKARLVRTLNARALKTYWRLQVGVLVSQIVNSLLINTFGLALINLSTAGQGLSLGQYFLSLLAVRWPMSLLMAFLYPVLVYGITVAHRAAFRGTLPEGSQVPN